VRAIAARFRLLAGCCRCVFNGQACITYSFEAGEYRRRNIPHRGIAQVPWASAATPKLHKKVKYHGKAV
jgi:hypothetical protein